jgi:5S rRNA maturation endonuclease (ribonuclease M5)
MRIDEFLALFENPRKTTRGHVAKCPAHEDRQASLSISEGNDGRILLKCFAGCETGAVLSALGVTIGDLFQDRREESKPYRRIDRAATPAKPSQPKSESREPSASYTIERVYSYQDMLGYEVYQALRLQPKSFRQRHMVNGKWVWNMDGVERVLYKLPEVMAAETVWVLEGEKDVENMISIGFVATCNVGGAGKWLDGYTETLEGKDVVLCGDNDKPGQDHIKKIFDSIAGKARTVKIVKIPSPHKDASDFIAAQTSGEVAKVLFDQLAADATPFVHGVKFPAYTMAEIEPRYKRQVLDSAVVSLDLARWIPSFRGKIRPLIPGDFALVIAGTGVGKTNILANIWRTSNLATNVFEMELPEEVMFERFLAMKTNKTASEVEDQYRNNQDTGREILDYEYRRLLICPESKLSLETMEQIINKSELKLGEKVQLVLVDYVQLLQAAGNSRYERSSNIAEGLKVLAKSTRTIIVAFSQIGRPSKQQKSQQQAGEDEETPEPNLHDAKDSGSLENSAGLVIGAWRDNNNPRLLHMRVLKSTKGGGGTKVLCNFDGAKSLITEYQDPRDLPSEAQQGELGT